LAGFQVITYGRFWVFTEGNGGSGEPSRAAAAPPRDECCVRRIERAVLPPASLWAAISEECYHG